MPIAVVAGEAAGCHHQHQTAPSQCQFGQQVEASGSVLNTSPAHSQVGNDDLNPDRGQPNPMTRSARAKAPVDCNLLVRAVPVELTSVEPCAPPASITIPGVFQPDFQRNRLCQLKVRFAVRRYRFKAAAGRYIGLFLQECERTFAAYLLASDGSVLGEYQTRNTTQSRAERQILNGGPVPVNGSFTLVRIGLEGSIRDGMKLVRTSQPFPTVACDPPQFLTLPVFVTETMEPGDCLLSSGIRARADQ